MSRTYQLYVGVDIAAKTFTATWSTDPASASKAVTFDQTDTGFTRFQQALAVSGVVPPATLVALEATGSYWIALAVALHQANYVVSVLNPGQVALFARSLPRRSKTDTLDAHLLVRFAAARQPKGFAITARHGLSSPYSPSDSQYIRSLKQLRGKGIAPTLMRTMPPGYSNRTVDETLIGLFWAYDGVRGIGTPPRLYNQIVRHVAIQKGNTVDQNAQLFALVNAALGDAGILAWDQKYIHDFWRPVVSIREHDGSMGSAAPTPTHNLDDDCDPLWLPLGAPASNSADKNFTPPFPAYPSGHATFGAAALHMVRLFYGLQPGHRAG